MRFFIEVLNPGAIFAADSRRFFFPRRKNGLSLATPSCVALLAMRKVMLVFGALASECAALPAPANTPLHQETWQQRTAANAARRSFLMAPASQVNMTSKLQLASNIADAEVAAADQAWLNSRAAAKTLSDATAAARAQAEIGARAAAKAAHDANKAAEAEAEVEARAASKTLDDTKSAALAVHQTNLRADSKVKSDAMSLAASEAVKETRAGTKAATDAKAQVAAASRPVQKQRNALPP